VNNQRDAQFFSMYLFLFLTLYLFRAHRAHHRERQMVSIQPLVAVTLCRVQVGSEASDLSIVQAGMFRQSTAEHRTGAVNT
jgi:hypothetical protein